jgi:hypothetical protein
MNGFPGHGYAKKRSHATRISVIYVGCYKMNIGGLHSGTRRAGFLLTEAIAALALLGLLIFLVARFEIRAAAAAKSLEQEYMATVAAESQFERLKAGLTVLDAETFQRQYPGLTIDYRLQSSEGNKAQTGVVTVTTRKPEPRVLIKLAGPVPPWATQSGEKK